MFNKTNKSIFIFFTLFVFFFVGCNPNKKEKVPLTLNPVIAYDDTSRTINNYIFSGLLKYDKNNNLVGDLAYKWSVSGDNTVVRFHLRTNVRWHDGTAFTAEDVKYTFERIINRNVGSPYSGNFLKIEEVQVPDNYTVRVVYKEPFKSFLDIWNIGIIPKHIYENYNIKKHPANNKPIGTGPFIFKKKINEDQVLLDINKRYYIGSPSIQRKTPKSVQFVSGSTIPVTGDIYVAASIGDATYLNPVLAADSASNDINSLVYNGLVKYDKDLNLVGDLARYWSISEDGTVIRFILRNDAKWHDGKPFTSDDVKFTYEKLVDPEVRTPYSSDFLIIKEMQILGPYTVRIVYKKPLASSLESWGIGIIPKHIFEEGDFNKNPANRKPIGTGPYVFKEWNTDEKIVLEANPSYFEGKPLIDRYIYRIVPDQSVQFLELRNQSIDQMGLTPDQWNAYPVFFKNYNKFKYPSFSFTYLGFNLTMPLFSEKKFRQAIAHAIDKEEIINGVLLGMGKVASGPFPPQSWAYNHSVKDYEYDIDKSLDLLEELGWEDSNNDGYLDKDGVLLEFTILTNQGNKMRSMTAEIIQEQLKKIGVKVNVRIIEWSALVHQFIDKKKFEALVMGWGLARDPDQYSLWHTSQMGEGQYNFISYSNPDIDWLLYSGRSTLDKDERIKTYNSIHRIMARDLPCIFLYYPNALPVVHKRFIGPEVSAAGIGWNFNEWWVPKNRHKYIIKQ
ncbi:ABC transporter substrate-binding protein [Elusimicrobiota bacterium]